MAHVKGETQAMTVAGLNLIKQALSIYDSELKKVAELVKAGKVIESPIDDACDKAHEQAALKLWDEIGARDPAAAEAIGIIKGWRKTLK